MEPVWEELFIAAAWAAEVEKIEVKVPAAAEGHEQVLFFLLNNKVIYHKRTGGTPIHDLPAGPQVEVWLPIENGVEH